MTAFEFALESGGFGFSTDILAATAKLRELADQFEKDPKNVVLQRVRVITEAIEDNYTMTHIHLEFAERSKK
jgi:hypothetical protein